MMMDWKVAIDIIFRSIGVNRVRREKIVWEKMLLKPFGRDTFDGLQLQRRSSAELQLEFGEDTI